MKKSWLKLIALIAFTVGGAWAQTDVFYADDLARAPKGIAVSPGYLTVLEFFQEVDQVASGRPGMMKVEVNGSKIYISALVQSGATDLIVEVGARTQLFRVTFTKGNAPRRYVVVLQKPAPKVTPPPAPAPPVAPPAPVAAPPVAAAAKPVAASKPAPKPVAVSTPRPPANTSTVAASAVVGLNDPSVRNTAASPRATAPSRMVFADFERLQDVRPVSTKGGSATVSSFEQNPAARTTLPDATSGGPALLLDAEGALTQRAFFDYETRAPNQWAGASLDISALPQAGGRQRAMDASGYDALTLDLAATGTKTLVIELRSRDNGLQSEYGAYPQVQIAVNDTLKTYRIPLSSFRAPSWVKSPLNVKNVLKRLTEISIKVMTSAPAKGRVTVDNLTFERGVSAAQKSANAGSPEFNPAWLEFGVLRQVLGDRPGELAIYYTVKNTGSQAVTLNANGLHIQQSGRDLSGGLRVDATSFSLRPGQAHLGTIIVSNAKPGDLQLRWTAFETGSGNAYLLERSLRVQVMPGGGRP